MKRIFIIFCILHAAGQVLAQNDSITLVCAKWTVKKLNPDVVWKNVHFTNNQLFKSNQNINIIEISPHSRKIRLAVAFSDSLQPTSQLAEKNKSLVAINGSFFKMRGEDPDYSSILTKVSKMAPAKMDVNRSVVYLRVNNKLIADNVFGKTKLRRRHQTGALAIFKRNLLILKADTLDVNWERSIVARDVITSGPILLNSGKNERFPNDDFCNDRHPRTAVGKKKDGTILLFVVDGRSPSGKGMTIDELQKTLKWLSCVDALNLDGGGSSTMVIRGQPNKGVVNYPTDNKKFDHEGERDVANALVVLEKQ